MGIVEAIGLTLVVLVFGLLAARRFRRPRPLDQPDNWPPGDHDNGPGSVDAGGGGGGGDS